jgi:hypothetical protein
LTEATCSPALRPQVQLALIIVDAYDARHARIAERRDAACARLAEAASKREAAAAAPGVHNLAEENAAALEDHRVLEELTAIQAADICGMAGAWRARRAGAGVCCHAHTRATCAIATRPALGYAQYLCAQSTTPPVPLQRTPWPFMTAS